MGLVLENLSRIRAVGDAGDMVSTSETVGSNTDFCFAQIFKVFDVDGWYDGTQNEVKKATAFGWKHEEGKAQKKQ